MVLQIILLVLITLILFLVIMFLFYVLFPSIVQKGLPDVDAIISDKEMNNEIVELNLLERQNVLYIEENIGTMKYIDLTNCIIRIIFFIS